MRLEEVESGGVQPGYGMPWRSFNGRDVTGDLVDELLNAARFAMQMHMEVAASGSAHAGLFHDSPAISTCQAVINLQVTRASLEKAQERNARLTTDLAIAAEENRRLQRVLDELKSAVRLVHGAINGPQETSRFPQITEQDEPASGPA